MVHNSRAGTRAGVVMSTLVAGAVGAPVVAQEVGQKVGEEVTDATQISEVVVTARKRIESLQEVPESITAFTRADIERSAILRLQDYADLTPNLGVEQGDSELDYNVTIRGIGDLGGTQNTFGLYLDGFELTAGSAEAVSADLSDVERIEVLRGPQGTTFGRNVIAGAINLTSIAPTSDRVSGSVEGELGSYGSQRARGSVNLPLIDGKAAVRISGSYRASDGYIRNVGPAGDRNDYERKGARVALRLTPTERFTVDLGLAFQDLDQSRYNTVFDGHLISTVAQLRDLIDAGFGGVPPGSLPAGPTPFPAQNKQVATNTPSFLDASTRLTTLRGQYDFDSFSIVSVSGYIETDRDNQFDVDDSPYDLFISRLTDATSEFWSSELRVQSNGDKPLNWVLGGYTSRAEAKRTTAVSSGLDAETVTSVFGSPLVPNGLVLIGGDFEDESSSEAVFGELGYKFTDKLSATAGVRNNHDSSTGSQFNGTNLLAGQFVIPDETQKVSFDKVTWRTSVQFAPTKDQNLYASVSKGYRAGGVQLQSLVRPDFGPEQAMNYELGAKAFFLDRSLLINIALFRTNWEDVQIQTFDFTTGGSSTDNVGQVRIRGVDLDMQWRPIAGLQLTAGLGYLDNRIVEYVNADGGSFAGSPLPNTPKWSASLTTDYQHHLFGVFDGFVRASYAFNGKRLESVDDITLREFLPAWHKVDLRTGLRNDEWTVELFAQNVLDRVYAAGLTTSGFSLAGSAITSPPRVFGIRVAKEF